MPAPVCGELGRPGEVSVLEFLGEQPPLATGLRAPGQAIELVRAPRGRTIGQIGQLGVGEWERSIRELLR